MINLPTTADYISTVGMTQAEWLAMRRKVFGGSDVAELLFGSRLNLYWQKTSDSFVIEESLAMKWGKLHEPAMRLELGRQLGVEVLPFNAMAFSRTNPFFAGNFDGYYIDPKTGEFVLVELKTCSEWMKDEWEGGAIPPRAATQVQSYFGVEPGFARAKVFCLCGGNKEFIVDVYPSPQTIEYVQSAALQFRDEYLIPKYPPPACDQDADLIKRLYPEEFGEVIELPLDALDHIADYLNAVEAEGAAGKIKDGARAALCDMLKEAQVGMVEGHKVTWKAGKNGTRRFGVK